MKSPLIILTAVAALTAGPAFAQLPNSTGSQSDKSAPAQAAQPKKPAGAADTHAPATTGAGTSTMGAGAGAGAAQKNPDAGHVPGTPPAQRKDSMGDQAK